MLTNVSSGSYKFHALHIYTIAGMLGLVDRTSAVLWPRAAADESVVRVYLLTPAASQRRSAHSPDLPIAVPTPIIGHARSTGSKLHSISATVCHDT